MGCNCKAKPIQVVDNNGLGQKIVKNVVKVTVFLFSLILLPFIMLMVMWFMFDMLVLNQNVDLGKILNFVIDKTKRFHQEPDEDDEDDDDFDELTEDDVILLDSEDITDKSN